MKKSPFWNLPNVTGSIERLAQQDDLTVVVGAGASVESGFPLWGELISRLVTSALETYGSGNDEAVIHAVAERVRSQGPLAAASYAKTMLGHKFESSLRSCLYQDVLAPEAPGNISSAIARLFTQCGPNAELLTLNYDEQLLSALRGAAPPSTKVDAVNHFRKGPAGTLLVRHVHGRLYGAGAANSVVIAEEDYFGQNTVRASRDRFMRERLDGTATLFVGTSLVDSNLLGYLHAQKNAVPNKHVAVLTNTTNLDQSETDLFENATSLKWRQVGVTALQNHMYAQTAQFVHEVAMARELKAYVPYKLRLNKWDEDMRSWVHSTAPAAFLKHQDLMHDQLTALIGQIHDHLDSLGIPTPVSGRLVLELWSRKPATRSLALIASTACRFVDPELYTSLKVDAASVEPAVAAFTTGGKILVDLSSATSRWGGVLALPVTIDNHPEYWRLPVGALVLRSTLPLSESIISRFAVEAPDIDDLLVGPGSATQSLLDPRGSAAS